MNIIHRQEETSYMWQDLSVRIHMDQEEIKYEAEVG